MADPMICYAMHLTDATGALIVTLQVDGSDLGALREFVRLLRKEIAENENHDSKAAAILDMESRLFAIPNLTVGTFAIKQLAEEFYYRYYVDQNEFYEVLLADVDKKHLFVKTDNHMWLRDFSQHCGANAILASLYSPCVSDYLDYDLNKPDHEQAFMEHLRIEAPKDAPAHTKGVVWDTAKQPENSEAPKIPTDPFIEEQCVLLEKTLRKFEARGAKEMVNWMGREIEEYAGTGRSVANSIYQRMKQAFNFKYESVVSQGDQ